MRIERVALENFLAFKEICVEFAPGLNVVLSPNEGGKSSLFRGIAAGLYANAATKSGEILSLMRWGSAARFRIEIVLRFEDAPYRLVRDFDSREQTISRIGESKPFKKGRFVDEFLSERLPFPDERLFLRVCGVRHEELGAVCDGASGIGEAIEEALGGGWGNVTPAGVQQTIEAKLRELVKGRDRPANVANRGPLKRFIDDVERLERDEARAAILARSRVELLTTISGIDAKMRCLEAEIELLRAKKEKASADRDLEKNEKALREKADGLRKRRDRLRELCERRRALAGEGSRFPEAIARGTKAFFDATRADLERELVLGMETAGAGPARGERFSLWRPILGSILMIAGGLGVTIGRPIMAVCLAAGAALIAWHIARRSARMKEGDPGELRDQLDRLAGKREALFGGIPPAEAKTILSDFAAWRELMRDIASRIEETGGAREVDAEALIVELDREYGEAALGLRALEESRSELEPFRIDGDGLLKLERDVVEREEERKRLAAERALAERKLVGLERADEIDIAERLAVAKEGLRRAERKERVLGAILEALAEGRREIAAFLAERLPPLAAEHLARITGGRYETLFIDPLTMRVETLPARADVDRSGSGPAAPPRIRPDEVSQGARDQMYLAVRLALVELLSRGESQPVFLDDPFVHFDPERRARALDVVREFAAKHQVVLFTCDPRHRGEGGRLVELPPRT